METILKASNITKKYGNKLVINDISLTINRGDIYGFIGRNGAGKTTFMRIVLSLAKQNSGTITFFENQTITQAGIKIGSLIEEPGLFKNATAYENLKRFCILYGADCSKINELLDLVKLNDVGKKKVKNFSLGMRQRLGIAIALLKDPEFLVLDEPVNGLDPYGIQQLREIFLRLNKEKNVTLFISSHYLDELSKIVTKYGIIDNGILLEEIEADKLKEKCKDKIIADVDNLKKAKEVLSTIIPSENIVENNDFLEIYNYQDELSKINKILINNDINVNSVYQNFESVEDYFMKKIGGKS